MKKRGGGGGGVKRRERRKGERNGGKIDPNLITDKFLTTTDIKKDSTKDFPLFYQGRFSQLADFLARTCRTFPTRSAHPV